MHSEIVPFKTSKNVLMEQVWTSFSISIYPANKARFASAHDVRGWTLPYQATCSCSDPMDFHTMDPTPDALRP